MKLPVLGLAIDERFLRHRQRSTSWAGIVSTSLALGLFTYRYYHDGLWRPDLLAVGVTFVAVKLAVLLWSRLTD